MATLFVITDYCSKKNGEPALLLEETSFLTTRMQQHHHRKWLKLNSYSRKRTGAQFATADIKNFYLNNPLSYFQYMKIHSDKIPPEIQNEYNTADLADTYGYIYFDIKKGMYGLKEAGIVAWKKLVHHLKQYGYEPMRLAMVCGNIAQNQPYSF